MRLLRPLANGLVATTAVMCAVFGAPATAQAAPSKPTPTAFPIGALATIYQSDAHGSDLIYWPVISSFTDIRKNHPATISENLEKSVAINNAAQNDPALRKRALDDAYAIDGLSQKQLHAMTDAFGSELGADVRQALAEKRLPKVTALVDTLAARGQGIASSTLVEKEISDNPRPYKVAPNRIKVYNLPGKTDEDVLSSGSSYPSGHTASAMIRTGLLALMVPEFAPQLLARGSEAGYHRVVLGVHYPLDVIAGRMVADAAVADRYADPRFRPLIVAAGQELRAELEWRCGAALSTCIARDTPYRSTPGALADYDARMSYGLSRIGSPSAAFVVPPTAVDLVLRAHPRLTRTQATDLLRRTAYPAGYPLDDQRPGAQSWQRLDLARAYAYAAS
ncbi:phosphatase PAP2 family protein [Gordonia sp. 852002-10350_SCH5691597]|uniref:phosphatase PAP2 family protein n=1 Tax=Gordonia sp. 852002-10350_SCH5691597 TaxID=1834085 RepID=UPI0007E98EAB|nr:phosphatase PAP2 family protein [Gordonia sp. 852002-10350_SCH5691597]OBA63118.1 acid phosphatase [Gordonia sp. 852002-10350_SCH5691597]